MLQKEIGTNMKRITVSELYPLELEVLKCHIALAGYDNEGTQFIYNNLFRDEDGVAYYPSKDRKRLLALYTD